MSCGHYNSTDSNMSNQYNYDMNQCNNEGKNNNLNSLNNN